LYILWGLVQQYLLNGYLVNRLEQFGAARGFAPGLAAALFCLAHSPNWFLMAVTLVGGYACARFYLRDRNLYVLAIAHGMVAFCLYRVTPEALGAHFLVGPRYFISHGFRI
jgi:membrane protease YdiL (CAAX protease family)